jgi:hypothetical protein
MVLDDSTDDQDGGALDEEVIRDVTLLDDEADGRSGEDNVRCAMARRLSRKKRDDNGRQGSVWGLGVLRDSCGMAFGPGTWLMSSDDSTTRASGVDVWVAVSQRGMSGEVRRVTL